MSEIEGYNSVEIHADGRNKTPPDDEANEMISDMKSSERHTLVNAILEAANEYERDSRKRWETSICVDVSCHSCNRVAEYQSDSRKIQRGQLRRDWLTRRPQARTPRQGSARMPGPSSGSTYRPRLTTLAQRPHNPQDPKREQRRCATHEWTAIRLRQRNLPCRAAKRHLSRAGPLVGGLPTSIILWSACVSLGGFGSENPAVAITCSISRSG
ncbi:hypothetical protein C8R43DRAFT_1007581 [Mycena crocata]|nr:hypothetical protein C8R43DRAFT_1007581 [Mycena crocata]